MTLETRMLLTLECMKPGVRDNARPWLCHVIKRQTHIEFLLLLYCQASESITSPEIVQSD